MEQDRRKEVIDCCLELFVSKGLSETSTRDLSKALKLQNAGVYYYFQSKSDAVIACFEEALFRLEINLILPTFVELDNPEKMVSELLLQAASMKSLMRFVVECISSLSYREALTPSLDRMHKRMSRYSERIGSNLGRSSSEVQPYLNMMVSALAEYMLFEDEERISLQIFVMKQKILELLNERKK